MSRVKRIAAGVITLVLLLGVAGAGLWWRHTHDQEQDRAVARTFTRFEQAWRAGKLAASGVADPAAATSFDAQVEGLEESTARTRLTGVRRTGDAAAATLEVSWDLGSRTPWTYRLPVSASRRGETWQVDPPASGSYLHPQAPEGGREAPGGIVLNRTPGRRGDLRDVHGSPLMPMGTVFPVSLDPARATRASATALERLTGEPAGSLVAKLTAAQRAGSRATIPVITYREKDFVARRARLDAMTGVIYPRRSQPLARTRTFGQPLLGSYGEVTQEIVRESRGRYAAGDRAGISGLQRQYDSTLAAKFGVQVMTSQGETLFEQPTVDGQDVRTTIDPRVQEAAETAIATTGSVPSALVAIDIPTGGVRAVANNPALGMDRALTGHFPPGSTMKVATTYALLQRGTVTPSSVVPCPARTTVDGMRVRNFEGGSGGAGATFAQDFADSCNTAFVTLAGRLPADGVSSAAAALGVTGDWAARTGVRAAYAGSVPRANGATDQAAGAIGQGRDLASPLAMASMAATVARGRVIEPTVAGPDAGRGRTGKPLDPAVLGRLRTLMRAVVTSGSGTALASVPGGPVHGKSGTAEFGTQTPPQTHAWFVGWQGDTAFAVLVERGRSGGSVAAPVARTFLTELAR